MLVTRIPNSIVEGRARLIVQAVFFSVILYDQSKLQVITGGSPEDGGSIWMGVPCQTALTDGYNLVVNLDYMTSLNVDERVFVFAHEVYHIMARHPDRMRKYTMEGLFNLPFLPFLYNIAADAVINFTLVKSKIGQQPKGTIDLKKIGNYTLTGLETAEEIYKKLLDNSPGLLHQLKQLGNHSDKLKDIDQQFGGKFKDDPLGNDVLPESPDADAASATNEATMKAAIRSAIQQAKSQGTIPAGIQRFVDEFLEPQVRWQDLLRDNIRIKAGRNITSWRRPNRRKIVSPGVYMPKHYGLQTGNIVAAIDTSASVSNDELRQYLGELASILGDMRPESLVLIWCDARVDAVVELTEPEELRELVRVKGAIGGGGTSFIPPFEYVRDNDIPCDTFIYLTDGYGPFPSEELAPFPTIWCISSDVVAPFGTTIRITL